MKAILVSIACALATPTLAQTSTAPPLTAPDGYQDSARIFLRSKLLDPDSAKMDLVRPPRWGSFIAMKTPWSKPETGWLVCFSINAKNAMGGYTGYQTAIFVVNAAGYAQSAYFERDYDLPSGNRVTRECQTPQ